MCERVTWGSCPNCGERAAVGWTEDTVTELDCMGGCGFTADQMAEVQRQCDPPAGG